jgi:uncharacterized protein
MDTFVVLKWVVLVLIIVGALNWGLVGAFHFNLVSAIFGESTIITRIIYILVGLAGLAKIYIVVSHKAKTS